MKLRFASSQDIPQLRRLWRRVFGDPEEYLDLFFRNCFPHARAMVAEENGAVLSALYLLPLTLFVGERAYPAAYIYAVATDPDHRGQGLSTALLGETHRLLTAEGVAATVLVPAETGLFSYYGARGFETAFTVAPLEWTVSDGETIPLREATAAEILPERNRFFAPCALYGAWDADALAYRVREAEFVGGKALAFTYKKHDCYAICVPDGETLRITELAAPADEIVLRSLARYFGKRRVFTRLPAENGAPFAMLHRCAGFPPLPAGKAALSLVLD